MIGFDSELSKGKDEKSEYSDIINQVVPEDIIEYGMIPEMVGRLPVITTLQALDEGALIDILTKPKNALIKQYQRFFEMEDAQLEFADDALHTLAKKALDLLLHGRNTCRTADQDDLVDVVRLQTGILQAADAWLGSPLDQVFNKRLELGPVKVRVKCFGPAESAVMNGKLISVCVDELSSHLALSAASFSRCKAIGSVLKSMASCWMNVSTR